MKATKSRLSWFKKHINEHLPEGEDIYGFAGISKTILIDSLNESYNTLDLLLPYSGRFETVFLEREISELYEKANSKLAKEDFNKHPDSFNDFLKVIQKIRSKIKETYILLAKEPIRSESEIQKLKDELVILQDGLNTIKPIFTELSAIKENSEKIIDSLSSTQNDSIQKKEEVTSFLASINTLKAKAEKTTGQIKTWEDKLKTTTEELQNNLNQYQELNKTISQLKKENESNEEKITNLTENLKQQIEINNKFQDQIQKSIDDVNRFGMAGSFKKRKDELTRPYWFWTAATIITIVVLIVTSSVIIIKAISSNTLDWSFLMLRLPIFASFVWLGWFCTKQFGFISRIREDYSYKYAVSLAFEGYKKETRDVDEELLKKLLNVTIDNISTNPLHIYETRSNHGTPAHELLHSFRKKSKSSETNKKEDSATNADTGSIKNNLE